MQGYQRKFGQSPSQDNLQMLSNYQNQMYFPNQNGSSARMATPPPPNTQQKIGGGGTSATTIQGTGVKIMNNPKFSASMKIPSSASGSNISIGSNNNNSNPFASNPIVGIQNVSQVPIQSQASIIDTNRKLRADNEILKDRIKDVEAKGKQSSFDYSKSQIDVSSYILTNYSKFCELLGELHEVKNQYHEETKKNKQMKEINDQQLRGRQRGGQQQQPQQNSQEMQEQARQLELNRQIENVMKENSQLEEQYKTMETAFQTGKMERKSNPTEMGFASAAEKQELQDRLTQLTQSITVLTEQMQEQENKQKEQTANNSKKNFFNEYDLMGRQVANLRQLNQDLNENLKAKVIEIHRIQGKEPPTNFQPGGLNHHHHHGFNN